VGTRLYEPSVHGHEATLAERLERLRTAVEAGEDGSLE